MKTIKLILLEGPDPGQEFALTGEEYTVGRDPKNSWTLDYNAVSRHHAKLTKHGTSYMLNDLGSSNGTFVNGQKIAGAFLLSGGEEIGFGYSVKARYEVIDPTPAKEEIQSIDDLLATKVGGTVGLAKTTVGEVLPPMGAVPRLSVTIAGSATQTYTLNKKKLTFGRGEDNDIVIPSPVVSRHHGYIEKNASGSYEIVALPEAGNAVYLDGLPVSAPSILTNDANIRIGGQTPGLMVSMVYLSPSEAATVTAEINFGDKTIIQIGRASDNDVILKVPQVSQFHAQIEKVGQRYKVKDLDSTNGTFVNDTRIKAETWLSPDDTVRIGPYRYVMGVEALAQFDDSVDLRVEVLGLNKWVRDDLNILQNISLVFKPREFIVVVGQSGGGKSTLVDAIAGYRPATHGQVRVNDTNVYENFEAIRDIIGFVPQKDIIHMELSVFDALDYTAQLRMPPDTTVEERHKRVEEVMQTLDIAHRRDNQILELSGGQQKRVSIGVELLTKPGLFFLDEPSSGLDPGTETSLMHLMRQMADQGRTIILITHATKNVFLADKVVFLARGGFLSWFGPPDEALAFFDQYRSERDRRTSAMEFDQIYAVLEDTSKGTPEEWAERYRQHPAYQKYVVNELGDKARTAMQASPVIPASAPSNMESRALAEKQKKVSALRQFVILSKRNLRILSKDRFSLGLMLAASPLMGMMSVLLASVLGNDPFNFMLGDMNNVVITLFLLTIYAVMIGGLSQMREIVKEGEIYKRERLVNLKILPYVLSKVWVAAALALYQTATYMIIHFLAFKMPGGITEFLLMYISLTLATLAGMMWGLFASALSPSANAAPLIVILLMLPQIVMAGVLVPMPKALSGITSTNWAFQGFLGVTGIGSDLASDICMVLPPEQIALMTAEDKIANGCLCLGANALREESCYFPGNGRFYNPAIDEALPQSPGPEPVRPADPVIPEAPAQPEDQSDTVAVADYLAALEKYQIEVEAIQTNTKAEFATYESQVALYRAEVVAYQDAMIRHQAGVASAVQPVETILIKYNDKFGSAFVNKENAGEYWGFLLKTWMAQLVISGVLFVGIVFLQKRKDVN